MISQEIVWLSASTPLAKETLIEVLGRLEVSRAELLRLQPNWFEPTCDFTFNDFYADVFDFEFGTPQKQAYTSVVLTCRLAIWQSLVPSVTRSTCLLGMTRQRGMTDYRRYLQQELHLVICPQLFLRICQLAEDQNIKNVQDWLHYLNRMGVRTADLALLQRLPEEGYSDLPKRAFKAISRVELLTTALVLAWMSVANSRHSKAELVSLCHHYALSVADLRNRWKRFAFCEKVYGPLLTNHFKLFCEGTRITNNLRSSLSQTAALKEDLYGSAFKTKIKPVLALLYRTAVEQRMTLQQVCDQVKSFESPDRPSKTALDFIRSASLKKSMAIYLTNAQQDHSRHD